jgi:integrase
MAAFDKTNRRKLEVQKKPHFMTIAPGLALGYRRNDGAGAWVVREAIGNGNSRLQKFATADDLEAADGGAVMSYAQALVYANRMKRSDRNSKQLITVQGAIDAYEADLTARGQSIHSATSIRFHLKDTPLYKKPVALLEKSELEGVRNALVTSGKKASSADRIGKSFKAAMNLAASHDPRITNSKAWSEGWKLLPNSSTARNIILSDATVAALVHAAYEADHKLGVYFDVLAETGTRESQMLRLRVSDLQDGRIDPRLMMPSSRKGRNRKPGYKPVPISPRLALILRSAAAGRAANDPMLDEIAHCSARLREIAKLVGGVDPEATPYSFRHSSIVRMLVKNIPIRIVAALHDTSVEQIERHYSAFITDVSDAMTRATLPDFGTATEQAIAIQQAAILEPLPV